jgi:hypothetical protein
MNVKTISHSKQKLIKRKYKIKLILVELFKELNN